MALPTTLKRKLVSELGNVTDKSAATLPATGTQNLFTITNGRVIITTLIGEVTTVIASGLCDVRLQFDPETGTTIDISGGSNISAKEEGTLIGFTGISPANALKFSSSGGMSSPEAPFIVNSGAIEMLTDATNTGQTKWTCVWHPLDEGASLASA